MPCASTRAPESPNVFTEFGKSCASLLARPRSQPPPVVPSLTFTDVIVADDTIRACYRNPVLTLTPAGTLLCFIEERSRGPAWHPNEKGDHSCA